MKHLCIDSEVGKLPETLTVAIAYAGELVDMRYRLNGENAGRRMVQKGDYLVSLNSIDISVYELANFSHPQSKNEEFELRTYRGERVLSDESFPELADYPLVRSLITTEPTTDIARGFKQTTALADLLQTRLLNRMNSLLTYAKAKKDLSDLKPVTLRRFNRFALHNADYELCGEITRALKEK